MKKWLLILLFVASMAMPVCAQSYWGDSNSGQTYNYSQTKEYAKIVFSNDSGYTMTLKMLKMSYGSYSLYTTITLSPYSRKTVQFGETSSYKLKIKAVRNGSASYHDGGNFDVTCTDTEWTEGEMSFSLSSYGNGLGPSISASEFEKNN